MASLGKVSYLFLFFREPRQTNDEHVFIMFYSSYFPLGLGYVRGLYMLRLGDGYLYIGFIEIKANHIKTKNNQSEH